MAVKPWDVVITDIEGNGLYHDVTRVHCAVAIDVMTEDVLEFGPDSIEDYLELLRGCKLKCGHNVLDYDFPSLEKLHGLITPVDQVCDTLVVSRMLFPERPGGHSLDAWGKSLGEAKIDYRARAVELELIEANAPKGAEFQVYHPEMLVYCRQDGRVNLRVLQKMLHHLGWTLEELIQFSQEVQLYNG
jgi:hypothetical protein